MKVLDLLSLARANRPRFQLHINEFVDTFRRAPSGEERARLVADGPPHDGELEGLVSAIVSALCRETQTPAPTWVEHIASPSPFFVVPAKGYALRVRLMLESPPPFRVRKVFVPENYLSRA